MVDHALELQDDRPESVDDVDVAFAAEAGPAVVQLVLLARSQLVQVAGLDLVEGQAGHLAGVQGLRGLC